METWGGGTEMNEREPFHPFLYGAVFVLRAPEGTWCQSQKQPRPKRVHLAQKHTKDLGTLLYLLSRTFQCQLVPPSYHLHRSTTSKVK